MKHILPKLALLGVAAFLAAACNKNTGEGTNVALKRQFDAWRAIHYPAAVEKDGIYIIEDTPGTGAAWDKNLSITFMTYTMRSLDGTVSYNTDEQWAKQLGEWDQTYYYGAQVVLPRKACPHQSRPGHPVGRHAPGRHPDRHHPFLDDDLRPV